MTGQQILFYFFGALALVGAIATVTRGNPVVAVVCLVGTFFGLAGVYATLHAHFLAAIQVLVYAGAIMVLFIFVVMLLGREESEPWWRPKRGIGTKLLGIGALGYVASRFIGIIVNLPAEGARELPADFGTVASIGKRLLTEALFPFEAISVLLLVAIVGALVVASHHHHDAPARNADEPEPHLPSEGH
jgi:NADH-quinone oxidoreductase subunit J